MIATESFFFLIQRVLEPLARATDFWLKDRLWLQEVAAFSSVKKRVYTQGTGIDR